jgi:hypothetical protein
MATLDEHALAIAAAISGASLCWRCIAENASLTAAELDEALIRLRRTRHVVLTLEPCGACRRDTLVYRLGDSAASAS